MPSVVDVLILGGGPAGLSCAGSLARQLHTAIVFSHDKFRDERASHMHNLTCWDHHHPFELRQRAREEIFLRYDTIEFKDIEVRRVRKRNNGQFEAVDTDGARYLGRRVLLATGVTDLMPSLPGYAELWGRGIFHCLFCQGYEEKGAPSAGVLATGLMASTTFIPPTARMAGRLAETINVYTNGPNENLTNELRSLLENTAKYKFIDTEIERLEKDPNVEGDAGILVRLRDRRVIKEAFIAHSPPFKLNGPFAKDLGVEVTPQGNIDSQPPFFNTTVPGVFAAGDCATFIKAVPTAIAMGSCAAAGIAHSLQVDDDVAE